MPTCRSCGAEIQFLKTAKGTFHPVEGLEPEIYYLHQAGPMPGRGRLRIVLRDGTVISGWQGTQWESGVLRVEGYESHFATCPGADSWRQKRSWRQSHREWGHNG